MTLIILSFILLCLILNYHMVRYFITDGGRNDNRIENFGTFPIIIANIIVGLIWIPPVTFIMSFMLFIIL